ncbi:MAG TPA: hypothetical protein VG407_18145 [Caulobacteraceae bacterium]|jgi:hypothetical protein|nr:hypothetical protein [Caulobacteraceae bacterium]
MKWVQILNMAAAGYVVAVGTIIVIAMVAEPSTLRDYTGQAGAVSVVGVVLFVASALYIGVRTIYQAIRALYLRD